MSDFTNDFVSNLVNAKIVTQATYLNKPPENILTFNLSHLAQDQLSAFYPQSERDYLTLNDDLTSLSSHKDNSIDLMLANLSYDTPADAQKFISLAEQYLHTNGILIGAVFAHEYLANSLPISDQDRVDEKTIESYLKYNTHFKYHLHKEKVFVTATGHAVYCYLIILTSIKSILPFKSIFDRLINEENDEWTLAEDLRDGNSADIETDVEDETDAEEEEDGEADEKENDESTEDSKDEAVDVEPIEILDAESADFERDTSDNEASVDEKESPEENNTSEEQELDDNETEINNENDAAEYSAESLSDEQESHSSESVDELADIESSDIEAGEESVEISEPHENETDISESGEQSENEEVLAENKELPDEGEDEKEEIESETEEQEPSEELTEGIHNESHEENEIEAPEAAIDESEEPRHHERHSEIDKPFNRSNDVSTAKRNNSQQTPATIPPHLASAVEIVTKKSSLIIRKILQELFKTQHKINANKPKTPNSTSVILAQLPSLVQNTENTHDLGPAQNHDHLRQEHQQLLKKFVDLQTRTLENDPELKDAYDLIIAHHQASTTETPNDSNDDLADTEHP